mgnify:CR=1 FL=1
MNKKGQAAMEFLMTYGWAILVVLVAVATLSYFGVLDNKGMIPSKCLFSAPVPCVDHSFDLGNEKLTLAMRNNNGFPVEITNSISISSGCSSPTINTINDLVPPQTIANNEIAKIEITCGGLSSGKFKSDVSLIYNNPNTGLNHSHVGEIVDRLE